jgi:hypothetical protein
MSTLDYSPRSSNLTNISASLGMRAGLFSHTARPASEDYPPARHATQTALLLRKSHVRARIVSKFVSKPSSASVEQAFLEM